MLLSYVCSGWPWDLAHDNMILIKAIYHRQIQLFHRRALNNCRFPKSLNAKLESGPITILRQNQLTSKCLIKGDKKSTISTPFRLFSLRADFKVTREFNRKFRRYRQLLFARVEANSAHQAGSSTSARVLKKHARPISGWVFSSAEQHRMPHISRLEATKTWRIATLAPSSKINESQKVRLHGPGETQSSIEQLLISVEVFSLEPRRHTAAIKRRMSALVMFCEPLPPSGPGKAANWGINHPCVKWNLARLICRL